MTKATMQMIQDYLEKIKGLEKENITLKESNRHKLEVCTELALQVNSLQEQLTKAKEIIKQFLNDYPVITKEVLDKLEQFLKEMEK